MFEDQTTVPLSFFNSYKMGFRSMIIRCSSIVWQKFMLIMEQVILSSWLCGHLYPDGLINYANDQLSNSFNI